MTNEKYSELFNEVDNLTAVCQSDISWSHGKHPELEIGKTYHVSHIGVLRSSSSMRLKEFGDNQYNPVCFDLYENGVPCGDNYLHDPRFWAPYTRNFYRKHRPQVLASHIEQYAIPAHLKDIERQYDVKILYAAETGSRAWGLESKDSDWDVSIIYVHNMSRDGEGQASENNIHRVYEDDVDIIGWELNQALSFFKEGNPTLLEWYNSTKVYLKDEVFDKCMQEVTKEDGLPSSFIRHYHRIYNLYNERNLQKESLSIKHFLYYLRGIMACKWIEGKQSFPPLSFQELIDATVDNEDIKSQIVVLVQQKKAGKSYDLTIDDTLVAWAKKCQSSLPNGII